MKLKKNITQDKTQQSYRQRLSTKKTCEILGVGRTFLWEKRKSGDLICGVHWVYATGKPNTAILWDVVAIQEWQDQQSLQAINAPRQSAEDIETFAEMGAL